jgi:uncharacterized protein
MKRNSVGWFEIPVSDMKRAIKFYEKVLDVKLSHQILGKLEMAWFPEIENGPGSPGSLVFHKEFYKPSSDGVLIYFTSPSGDIKNEENRIEGAGGKVLIPKRLISEEIGYMTVILDSEGNRIALHSRN